MPKIVKNLSIPYETSLKETIYPGLEKMMLPTEFVCYSKFFKNEDVKIITCHKVLQSLLNIVEKRHLSDYYAFETMRRLLKMNKYLYSYRHQVIELISVFEDTNDIRLKPHIDYLCKEINYVRRI